MKVKVERVYIPYPLLDEDVEEWKIYQGIPMLFLPFLTKWVLDVTCKTQDEMMKYLERYISCEGVTIKTTVKRLPIQKHIYD